VTTAFWHSELAAGGEGHRGIIVLTDKYAPVGLQLQCFRRLGDLYDEASLRDSLVFLLNYA
jgi:hypothetical protein